MVCARYLFHKLGHKILPISTREYSGIKQATMIHTECAEDFDSRQKFTSNIWMDSNFSRWHFSSIKI